jgi:transposase
VGRGDLSDEQWADLERVLPRPSQRGRPPARHRRVVIDGIRWRVRTGAPWRDLPACYGSWQTACRLFRCWQRDGTRAQAVMMLQAADAAGRISRLKRHRAVATRYDKLAVRYQATVHVAMLGEWL